MLWRLLQHDLLQRTPTWAPGQAVLVIGGICELAAVVCGITAWKSRSGKTAVLITGLVLLLVLPAGFILPIVLQERAVGRSQAIQTAPETESVEVSRDQAVVKQRYNDSVGMMITFGSMANRWTPQSVYLEALFDITLESRWFSPGANWVVKTKHGTNMSYHLDGPRMGKIFIEKGRVKHSRNGISA